MPSRIGRSAARRRSGITGGGARICSFDEVHLPLPVEAAIAEAARCMRCDAETKSYSYRRQVREEIYHLARDIGVDEAAGLAFLQQQLTGAAGSRRRYTGDAGRPGLPSRQPDAISYRSLSREAATRAPLSVSVPRSRWHCPGRCWWAACPTTNWRHRIRARSAVPGCGRRRRSPSACPCDAVIPRAPVIGVTPLKSIPTVAAGACGT